MNTAELITSSYHLLDDWLSGFGSFDTDDSLIIPDAEIQKTYGLLQQKLKNNYPFHHPCYAGQMLKPPHPAAVAAYLAVMRLNPNNHALDGGPATAELEKEAVRKLAAMFGFKQHLGHLTSSGTIANLEALWVANKIHPEKYIAFSDQAHYTHARMCEVIGAKALKIKSDSSGRIDLADLEEKLNSHEIGTVVLTTGTTGAGAIDPVNLVITLKEKYGFRIHIDAAYGGFYRVIAGSGLINGEAFKAIDRAESVVIDPHKHGLQPYGCGCVIFSDPETGKFYLHDSPYTYFTSKDLHLGEISLECSRAGASAAAFWTTLQLFPLEQDKGFGDILSKTRKAALKLSEMLKGSKEYNLLMQPELDIVCYYPKTPGMKASEISAKTEKIFTYLENHPTEPLYLAKYKAGKNMAADQGIDWDCDSLTILRSCLIKPEHLDFADEIYSRLKKAPENIL